MTPRQPQRIVVFCLPGIGDAVLFTPALRVLRRAFPAARLTAVTMFQGTTDLLETNPDLDEVRTFDFFTAGPWRRLRDVWSLRRARFDLSVLPLPSNRLAYTVVNRLVGRRWRAGHRYRRHAWRHLWFLNNVVVHEDGGRHNVEENLALAGAICRRLGVAVPSTEAASAVHLTAGDVRRADALAAAHGLAGDEFLIGLHAWSSTFKNMHRKCWPWERFVDLIARLREAHPRARFLLFSGPSDRAVSAEILRHAGSHVSVIDEPDLRVALALLARCRLFVSNDSGLMHLAGALRVPVVALFGPTDWRRLHPREAPHRIVRAALPCMPCFSYSSRPLRCGAGLDYACMRDLGVDDVYQASESLLAETAAPRPSPHPSP